MLHPLGRRAYTLGIISILCFFGHFSNARSEAVFGYEPELYFKQVYLPGKDHKAMAIGPGGLSLIRSGLKSAAAAESVVLRDCKKT